MKISVIGLGKLGSPMAAVFAAKGFQAIGVDLNKLFVDAINAGKAPVEETDLEKYIVAGKGNLTATTDFDYAITNSDVSFIIVPTPSGKDGFFSNAYVLDAVEKIGLSIRNKNSRHIVVITSTVMPGSTGGVIREKLETISGKRVGSDVGLCYNPEFIALGSVIHNMLHPDFILIGESDTMSGDVLEKIYKQVCGPNTEFRRMNWVNAEITKISINTFVTTKISYTNMISHLCEKIPESDAKVVLNAVGSDCRIGNKYLQAGLGYGGPCFPRDNVAFAALADKVGSTSMLAKITDDTNRNQPKRVLDIVTSAKCNSIGILGLAYKPGTPVIEKSQSILIADLLIEQGHRVYAFDPQVNMELPSVTLCNSIEDVISMSQFLIVATRCKEFVEYFKQKIPANKYILDCCQAIDEEHKNILRVGKFSRLNNVAELVAN